MDALTFVIELIRALAWPLTVLLIFFILRKRIIELFPQLQRLRYQGIEMEFSRGMQELSARAKDNLPAPEPIQKNQTLREHLIELAPLSPRAAVLEAWLLVEKAGIDAVKRLDVNLPSRELRSPLLLGQAMEDSGIINDQTTAIYHRLRNLRNIAAHATEFSIEPDLAIEYAELAIRLKEYLESVKPVYLTKDGK